MFLVVVLFINLLVEVKDVFLRWTKTLWPKLPGQVARATLRLIEALVDLRRETRVRIKMPQLYQKACIIRQPDNEYPSHLEEKSEDPQDQTGGRAEVSLAMKPHFQRAWLITETKLYLHMCVYI